MPTFDLTIVLHVIWMIFAGLFGGTVGSFLNVIIYRLPAGISVVTPPSRCPSCNTRLAWYDNVPVLGWLWLRGRCRYCQASISVQYPIIEAITAMLFIGVYVVMYLTDLRPAMGRYTPAGTLAMYISLVALFATLLAATVIDARYYIIPLPLPWTATLVALLLLPVAAIWQPQLRFVAPMASPAGVAIALGGAAGLLVAWGLLQLNLIPLSFDEAYDESSDVIGWQQQGDAAQVDDMILYDELAEAEADARAYRREHMAQDFGTPEQWLAYPHARREVLKECLYVGWPVAGMLLGYAYLAEPLSRWMSGPPGAMLWLSVLGGVLLGYLVGAAMIWGTRILGTLGFGKEAMGLGDMHLLAAIGAVLGWRESIMVFFTAVALGLVGAIVILVIHAIGRRRTLAIPFGPYLALGGLVVFAGQRWIEWIFGILLAG